MSTSVNDSLWATISAQDVNDHKEHQESRLVRFRGLFAQKKRLGGWAPKTGLLLLPSYRNQCGQPGVVVQGTSIALHLPRLQYTKERQVSGCGR